MEKEKIKLLEKQIEQLIKERDYYYNLFIKQTAYIVKK